MKAKKSEEIERLHQLRKQSSLQAIYRNRRREFKLIQQVEWRTKFHVGSS
jgi:hypothetical protein